MSNFSFSCSVFESLVLQTRKNQGLLQALAICFEVNLKPWPVFNKHSLTFYGYSVFFFFFLPTDALKSKKNFDWLNHTFSQCGVSLLSNLPILEVKDKLCSRECVWRIRAHDLYPPNILKNDYIAFFSSFFLYSRVMSDWID